MNAPGVDDKAVAIDRALEAAGIPHAFGGALALGFYAEPRATRDIDVNVFLPVESAELVLRVLGRLGIDVRSAAEAIERDGQCRVHWDRTPVDLFFSSLDFHRAMQRAVRREPFGADVMPFLGAEHLMVCKALFNRARDWLDIEQMLLTVADLRVDEVRRWMRELAGEDDERARHLAALIAGLRGA